jgi:hypothetical protein
MGVQFSFYNFTGLIDLHRGIVDRTDDSRLEAFSILYCDFSKFTKEKVSESLSQVLRSSDSYVHNNHDYFFILYQTDSYGSGIVLNMFQEFFAQDIKHYISTYPKDAESAQELFDAIQAGVKKKLNIDLECLDHSSRKLK